MESFKLIALLTLTVLFIPLVVYSLKKGISLLPINSFEWYISKTYFQSNKNKGFISLISNISIIGMMLGTAAVIIASSFMGGMKREITERFIGVDSHIKVNGYFNKPIKDFESIIDSIKTVEGVLAASPKIFNTGMIQVKGGNITKPIALNGIDINRSSDVNDIQNRMVAGSFSLEKRTFISNRSNRKYEYPGIVLGELLADELNLSLLDTGKILFVGALPKTLDFSATPTVQGYYFAGIADFGLSEYNLVYGYSTIESAQYLFQMPKQANYIDVKLTDKALNDLEYTAISIDDKLLYPYKARTWKEERVGLFSVLEFEKKIYMISLGLICCLAAFNILSMIYMLVKDKTKEIGVLRSLGANKKAIMRVFIYQGSIIGFIGAVGGILLGLILVHIQGSLKVITFPKNTMIIDYLPVEVSYVELIPLAIFTILVSTLAGIYPAYKASQLKPVEAFRYE